MAADCIPTGWCVRARIGDSELEFADSALELVDLELELVDSESADSSADSNTDPVKGGVWVWAIWLTYHTSFVNYNSFFSK